jgi:hypothetical protein
MSTPNVRSMIGLIVCLVMLAVQQDDEHHLRAPAWWRAHERHGSQQRRVESCRQ